MAISQMEACQDVEVIEMYPGPSATLQMSSANTETSVHVNYIKIIKSINPENITDILPSVMTHIESTTVQLERLELLQELGRILMIEGNVTVLNKKGILESIISKIIELFQCETSQSVQFELMSIICNFPQSHLNEKVLSRVHGAPQSASALIRRQSLFLVMKTLPVETSIKFIQVFLDDDDQRVRTTAIQNLSRILQQSQDEDETPGPQLPLSFYHKIIQNLRDGHDEVRLHSVEVTARLAGQHQGAVIAVPGAESSRSLTITQHAFMQLCMLMCDTSTTVRIRTAMTLGRFTDVNADFLIQTLDKKMKSYMKIVPEGSKVKQEYSAGRVWGGDAPIKSSAGEILLIDPAACGAFVHGMEDEFGEVRQHTVRSMCELAMACEEFGVAAVPHLIDMLNDEIQAVRLLTINSLQKITQNIELHEDQLETVLSVLEESSVEIRQSLHSLLSTAKLNSQVSLRRVLKGLLDNLKKYGTDCTSVYRCVRGVGANNASYAALLAPELLSKHPYLYHPETNTDDTCYIATMILVFNAAATQPIITSMFHEYTPRHYAYIAGLHPELVPNLPQVTKQQDQPASSSYKSQAMLQALNSILADFLRHTKTITPHQLAKFQQDVAKIQRLSPSILPAAQYLHQIISVMVHVMELRVCGRCRSRELLSRIPGVMARVFREICGLERRFKGGGAEVLTQLVKYYVVQLLFRYFQLEAEVTEKELAHHRDALLQFLVETKNPIPPGLQSDERLKGTTRNAKRWFSFYRWLLDHQGSLINGDVVMARATTMSPISNTDHIHEFPSHLALSLHIVAETQHLEPSRLAVEITFPGNRREIYQPPLECSLRDYYETTVFVGETSWSDPGLLNVGLVLPYELDTPGDAVARRLLRCETIWVTVSTPVSMETGTGRVEVKIHPKTPRCLISIDTGC